MFLGSFNIQTNRIKECFQQEKNLWKLTGRRSYVKGTRGKINYFIVFFSFVEFHCFITLLPHKVNLTTKFILNFCNFFFFDRKYCLAN